MTRLRLLFAFVAASLFAWTNASQHHRKSSHVSLADRLLNKMAQNATVPWTDDPEQLVKRDGRKYVFMHHVRCLSSFDAPPC